MSRRLYRSKTNRVLAGVCGGLAEYFDVDPLLVRIIFIILVLSGGLGILFYLISWLIMPSNPAMLDYGKKDSSGGEENKLNQGRSTAMFFGVILILLGLGFLLHNYGLFHFKFSLVWPLILIAIGIKLIFNDKR